MRKMGDFHDTWMRLLKDPAQAADYLEYSLEEGDLTMFLLAIRNVAEAHGGLSRVARLAKLNRSNLYKMLSKTGRPEIQSVAKVLDALGFKISIQPRKKLSGKEKMKKAA